MNGQLGHTCMRLSPALAWSARYTSFVWCNSSGLTAASFNKFCHDTDRNQYKKAVVQVTCFQLKLLQLYHTNYFNVCD